MSDLIKREDAIKAIAGVLSLNRFSSFKDIKNFDSFVERMLRIVPSAEKPQGEWIPCSERLPKKSGQYLVTAGIEQRQVAKGYYSAEYGRWYAVSDVSAWMPLPEPWKGESDAKEA